MLIKYKQTKQLAPSFYSLSYMYIVLYGKKKHIS